MTDHFDSLTNFEPQTDHRVNTHDMHRSDKRRQEVKRINKHTANIPVTKGQFRYFEKYVTDITMDLLQYKSSMTQFEFSVLDTVGYQEMVTLPKGLTRCSSFACKKKCQHLIWLFHNIFGIQTNEPLIYVK